MGAWGAKLYDDDVALDVKDEYIELLQQGIENEEVTKKMIDEWNTEDEDDGPVFWFALADIQWKYGRLLEHVKEKALHHIKTGTDLERWEEDKTLYNKRKKVLEELEEKLNSPMPKLKRIVKFKPYICPWNIGDVYAYQIKDDEEYKGKYIAVIKIEEQELLHNICPIIYVYNKLFDEIPKVEELKNVKYMPQFYSPKMYKEKYENMVYKCLMNIENSTKKFTNDYVYIGNMKNYRLPNNEVTKGHERSQLQLKSIKIFEEYIVNNYNKWKVAEISFKKTGRAKKWGVEIDNDDVAFNVKKEYEELLYQGIDNEEATKQMIDKWDTEDIEDGPTFWLALASIQWNYGRLLEHVKEKALYYIKTGTDLKSWKEDKALYSKRKKVLEELEKN